MRRLERYWDDKVVVVTGGAQGIGRELVLQLADAGASVAACDWSAAELDETGRLARERSKPGRRATTHVVDVSDRRAVAAFVEEVLRAHRGRIDALFNNAGVACMQSTFGTSREEWDRVVGINLGGVVNCTFACLEHLRSSPQAAIVNTSSLAGLVGMPGFSAYGTAKFAVRGFTEVLLSESHFLAPNITVTLVCPGGVTTNIFHNSKAFLHDTKIGILGMKRMATAKDYHNTLHTATAGTTPEAAASQILWGVARGKTRILVGTDVRMLDLISRLSPHLMLCGKLQSTVIPGLVVFTSRLIGRRSLISAGVLASAILAKKLKWAPFG